jgi:PAS domain S-box-containing protein
MAISPTENTKPAEPQNGYRSESAASFIRSIKKFKNLMFWMLSASMALFVLFLIGLGLYNETKISSVRDANLKRAEQLEKVLQQVDADFVAASGLTHKAQFLNIDEKATHLAQLMSASQSMEQNRETLLQALTQKSSTSPTEKQLLDSTSRSLERLYAGFAHHYHLLYRQSVKDTAQLGLMIPQWATSLNLSSSETQHPFEQVIIPTYKLLTKTINQQKNFYYQTIEEKLYTGSFAAQNLGLILFLGSLFLVLYYFISKRLKRYQQEAIALEAAIERMVNALKFDIQLPTNEGSFSSTNELVNKLSRFLDSLQRTLTQVATGTLSFEARQWAINYPNTRTIIDQLDAQKEKDVEYAKVKVITQTVDEHLNVLHIDSNGKVVYTNNAFPLFLGVTPSSILNSNLYNIFTNTPVIDDLIAAIHRNEAWNGILNANKKDRSAPLFFDVQVMPLASTEEKNPHFYLVCNDVTDYESYQEQLVNELDSVKHELQILRDQSNQLQVAQADMRQSQLELGGIINALDNSAILSTSDALGRILSINEQFALISRYSHEELIGQNHRILKSGHQQDELYERLWKSITNGEVWRGEFKNRSKEGNYYWISSTITPVKDEEGKIVKFIAVSFNISSQKLQEEQIRAALQLSQAQEAELRLNSEELQKAQEQMRKTQLELRGQIHALNNAGIVAETDLRGNITMVNQAFCNISKYTEEDLLGKNHRLLKSGDHNDEYYFELWECIAAGKVWTGMFKNRNSEGQFYWVKSSITPVLGFDSKPIKYIGVSFDVSAQVFQEEQLTVSLEKAIEQEEALLENERVMLVTQVELKGQINAIHNATIVFETNPMGQITSFNDKLMITSRFSREELLGQNPRIFRSDEHPQSFYAGLWQSINEGKIWRGEFRNLTRDKSVFWVATTITPVFDANGSLLKFICIMFEITTLKDQEETLRKSLDQTQIQQDLLEKNAAVMLQQQIELRGQISALNNAGIVSETDTHGVITYVNEEAITKWGYTREELIGAKHSIIRSHEHDDEFFSKMWQRISSGLVWKGVIKNRTNDETDFWCLLTITPVLDHENRPYKYIAVAYDITRQKRQSSRIKVLLQETVKKESELRAYAESFERIQEQILETQIELSGHIQAMNSAVVITETDLDGVITYANDMALQIWKYSRDELVGYNHRILKSGSHPSSYYEEMWERIAAGEIWKGNIINLSKHGEVLFQSLTITPILNHMNKPLKYVGVSYTLDTSHDNGLGTSNSSLSIIEKAYSEHGMAYEKQIAWLNNRITELETRLYSRTSSIDINGIAIPALVYDQHFNLLISNEYADTLFTNQLINGSSIDSLFEGLSSDVVSAYLIEQPIYSTEHKLEVNQREMVVKSSILPTIDEGSEERCYIQLINIPFEHYIIETNLRIIS